VSLNELQKEKERLITRYLQLQDVIDQYNNEVYKLCCQIEALNILIDGELKKAKKPSANGNGNGNGRGHPQANAARPKHPEAP
jgi:hypothetical protein